MKRVILRYIARITLFILLLVASVLIATFTHTGSRFIVQGVSKLLPGAVSYQQFSGRLSDRFAFTDLSYHDRQVQVAAGKLQITWSPWALLHKTVLIHHLFLNHIGVTMRLPAKATDKSASTLQPTIPTYLTLFDLENIEATDGVFQQAQARPIHMKTLIIRKQYGRERSVLLVSDKGIVKGQIDVDQRQQRLNWRADLTAEQVDLTLLAPNLPSNIHFKLRFSGQLNADQVQNMAVRLTGLSGELQGHHLAGYSDIQYDTKQLTINKSQLVVGDAALQVEGLLNQHWQLNWSLSVPHLETLIPASQGAIRAAGSVVGKRYQPKIKADLRAKAIKLTNLAIATLQGHVDSRFINTNRVNVTLNAQQVALKEYLFPVIQLTSASNYQQQQLSTEFKLNLNAGNQVAGKLTFPHFVLARDGHQPIVGMINVNLGQLNTLIAKAPQIKKIKGKLYGQAQIQGQLFEPLISGHLTLQEGAFNFSPLKTSVTRVALTSDIHYPEMAKVSGQFKVGQGLGKLQATVDFNRDPYPAQLNINGENLHIVNLPDYQIKVTPALNVALGLRALSIQGEVLVPFAKITPKDFSETVTLPSEVEFVEDQEGAAAVSPLALSMKVRLRLGSDIKLKYANLSTQLGGELTIEQVPGSLITAVGTLSTHKGKYQAYNNLLTIQTGKLLYSGNALTNPGLEIQAAKEITVAAYSGQSNFNGNEKLAATYTGSGKLTVGIMAKGTLNQPIVTFFSDPAGLAQGDILSYLVFGVPQAQVGAANSLMLLTLTPGSDQQFGPKSLKKSLGLTELGMGSVDVYNPAQQKTNSTMTLNVGKKIGKRLYLRYRVGVFDPVQILNLRYQISKRLAIQSETSGTDNGADILYEFEQD